MSVFRRCKGLGRLAVFALVALGSPTPAFALINFCFVHIGTYVDSADTCATPVGCEDYWVDTGLGFHAVTGVLVTLYKNDVEVWEGWTGDGFGSGDPGPGCVSWSGSGNYRFDIWSSSKVQDNYVSTTDFSSNYAIVTTPNVFRSDPSVVPIEFSASGSAQDRFLAHNVAAFSLSRHAGGMTGVFYSIKVGGSATKWTGSEVQIGTAPTNFAQKKFGVAHEFGHALLDFRVSKNTGAFCDDVAASQCPAVADDHSMLSKECSACAFNEGFAHFYAADVFNNHSQTNCAFEYYKQQFGDATPAINCEAEPDPLHPFENAFMENNCTATTIVGRGVEMDWLRTLWSVHTDGGSPASFNAILDWISAAPSWNCGGTFNSLDLQANAFSSINPLWDAAKVTHGIDH